MQSLWTPLLVSFCCVNTHKVWFVQYLFQKITINILITWVNSIKTLHCRRDQRIISRASRREKEGRESEIQASARWLMFRRFSGSRPSVDRRLVGKSSTTDRMSNWDNQMLAWPLKSNTPLDTPRSAKVLFVKWVESDAYHVEEERRFRIDREEWRLEMVYEQRKRDESFVYRERESC